MSGVVKRVVVMGGGTSGWMSACYLERVLARMQVADASVTLVESEDIGIIGVGEATLYRPGHFLSWHDDSGHPEQHRRVAYVLYLTRGWRADWGGQLQFIDAQGDVEEVWMPRFNSLALFLVPMPHLVTYVAPFATQPRFAITGWLCDGPPSAAARAGA